ncbi:MAG: hypothetical protein M1541_03600 [Acidobacteria bacterium]|nr:hypothetical protein [Acidobacteriota bacterium]
MRMNTEISVVAGTPVNAAAALGLPPERKANRVFAQMKEGGAGVGYVMDGIKNGRTPDATKAIDVTAVLAASPDATTPGGEYRDSDPRTSAGILLDELWFDGGNSGDKIRLSVDLNV